ncbi:unnamed protein product [Gongylonema pulchrum]|uniref:Uncharacterized protein n=1 Tax=Gongylonema pulchrum TaxID=637853 RepID=A0A3P7NER5_9BILA|nr:unnamed protein product [Gongylonema pulchrum]
MKKTRSNGSDFGSSYLREKGAIFAKKLIKIIEKNQKILYSAHRITRVSSCFAYWHYGHGETYGINVVSADDCDRFCKLIKDGCCLEEWNPREVARCCTASQSSMPTTIAAHIMKIFEVDKGIIKSRTGPFAECIIKITQNGALVRLNGKDFSLNLFFVKSGGQMFFSSEFPDIFRCLGKVQMQLHFNEHKPMEYFLLLNEAIYTILLD